MSHKFPHVGLCGFQHVCDGLPLSVPYRKRVIVQQQKGDASQTHHHSNKRVLIHLLRATRRVQLRIQPCRHHSHTCSGRSQTNVLLFTTTSWLIPQLISPINQWCPKPVLGGGGSLHVLDASLLQHWRFKQRNHHHQCVIGFCRGLVIGHTFKNI